jgi:chromosome segregation ATPase
VQAAESSLTESRNEINRMKPELQILQEKLLSSTKQLHETKHTLSEEQERKAALDDMFGMAQEEIVRVTSELKLTQSESVRCLSIATFLRRLVLISASSRRRARQGSAASDGSEDQVQRVAGGDRGA